MLPFNKQRHYLSLGSFFILFGAIKSFITTLSLKGKCQQQQQVLTDKNNFRRHALFSDLMRPDISAKTVSGTDDDVVAAHPQTKTYHSANKQGTTNAQRLLEANVLVQVNGTTDLNRNVFYKRKKNNSFGIVNTTKGLPWKAKFIVSSRTQRRIQDASKKVSSHPKTEGPTFESAIRVLESLLTTPPEECNEVNAMCALTLCTKKIVEETSKKMNINFATRNKKYPQGFISPIQVQELKTRLNTLLNIILQLIEDKQLNFRQLANAAWSTSKLLQLFQNIPIFSEEENGKEEEYVYTTKSSSSDALLINLEKVLQMTIQPITEHLSSERVSLKATTGEISMILWAYSQWRAKVEPTGWMWPPTDARLPLQKKQKQNFEDSAAKYDDVIIFEQLFSSLGEDRPVINAASNQLLNSADSVQVLMNQAAQILLSNIDEIDESQNNMAHSIGVTRTLPDSNNTVKRMIGMCTWNELSNIAHSFARSQFGSSAEGEALMKEICEEATSRLTTNQGPTPLPWDISLIAWSVGVMQVGKYHLTASLQRLIDAIIAVEFTSCNSKSYHNLANWNTKDTIQLSLALAHAALDNQTLLMAIFQKSTVNVDSFQSWELTVLLWVQARLYLTSKLGDDVYSRFTTAAVSCLRHRMIQGELDGLGSQGQANLAWSLTVLEEYSDESVDLLRAVFAEASAGHSYITHEHAHQLWQAFFLLKSECPLAVDSVPVKFAIWLEERWKEEKSRKKISSSSHKSLSDTLKLMRVAHVNEHDEDVDVTIVLEESSAWTSEASVKDLEQSEKRLKRRIGKLMVMY
jgi:hypothetical protein